MEQTEIKSILEDLGYELFPDSKGFRAAAKFRGGNNKTSLLVYKDSGKWVDFSENKQGTFPELVALTLGLKDLEKAKTWLKEKNFNSDQIIHTEPKLNIPTKISESELSLFHKDHSYFLKRGISSETLDHFECGVVKEGKMKNRFCFVVRNSKKEIVGITGRTLIDSKIKWKHFSGNASGTKTWVFPALINLKNIQEKREIILVESIGDLLSLYESGIKTGICLFGINLSLAVLNFIIKINPKRVIIALNGDSRGRNASFKTLKKIKRYFSKVRITIAGPPNKAKDFNDVLLLKDGKQKIKEWYNNLK